MNDPEKPLSNWSRWSGLNRRPTVYETVALPLSYTGDARCANESVKYGDGKGAASGKFGRCRFFRERRLVKVPWMLCVQSSFDAQEVSIRASGGPKSPAATRRMHVMVPGLRPWGRMELGAPLSPKRLPPNISTGGVWRAVPAKIGLAFLKISNHTADKLSTNFSAFFRLPRRPCHYRQMAQCISRIPLVGGSNPSVSSQNPGISYDQPFVRLCVVHVDRLRSGPRPNQPQQPRFGSGQ